MARDLSWESAFWPNHRRNLICPGCHSEKIIFKIPILFYMITFNNNHVITSKNNFLELFRFEKFKNHFHFVDIIENSVR